MANSIVIEAFLTDPAFIDQSKAINNFLIPQSGQVGALTPKVQSFFV